MQNTLKSTLILTLTAFIWGMAFVAQKQGMDHIGPFLFFASRSVIGAPALFLVLCLTSRFQNLRFSKKVIKGGIFCGCFLLTASLLQQIGIIVAPAGKAGFLTTLYIVLVPIAGIFLKKKTHWNTWVSVGVAAVGLYYLCIKAGAGFTIEVWDLLIILSAFLWVGHILSVDHTVQGMPANEVLKMCVVQFAFCGIVGMAFTPLFDGFFVAEVFDGGAILKALVAILYCGLGSTAAGYTLQAIGQRHANPSAAAIIMSLESVFSVLGGFLLLNERLTVRELFGCALMFAAVVLAQIPERRRQ